jgi:hypothetical protein
MMQKVKVVLSRKKNKRAMETNQMFVFIVSIIVVGLVLLFGTKAIMSFMAGTEDVQYVQFKTNLQDAIDDVASDYGSVKQRAFNMPGEYQKVCFVDIKKSPGSFDIQADSLIDGARQPLLINAWEDKTANVFLIDQVVVKSFIDERITLPEGEPYVCLKRQQGELRVRLEGVGRAVEVSEWR